MSWAGEQAVIDRALSVAPDGDGLSWPDGLARAKLDWVAVMAQANRHLVAPALRRGLACAPPAFAVPDDVRAYLDLMHAENAARNARIRRQCLELGRTLAAAGLRAALLKGAAWLFDGSTDAAQDRMMRDVDLLVPAGQVRAVVDCLVEAGYHDTGNSYVELNHFHHAPLLPREGVVSIELHRDLAHRSALLPGAAVLAEAQEVAPGLLLPSPSSRIVHNVVHAQIENGDWAGGVANLRDTLDLARLVARHDATLDLARLAAEARERGYLNALSGAVHCAHHILNSPLPSVFAGHLPGRLHAWRCMRQRRSRAFGVAGEAFGRLVRALAWERDAYGLQIERRNSLKAQFLVNRQRARRLRAAVGRRVGSKP